MAKKYTYSRMIVTAEGKEEFSAVEFDSFDEALKAVDKGVSDRRLQLKNTAPDFSTPMDGEGEDVETKDEEEDDI